VAKPVGKEALKTGSNITVILNKDAEQPVRDIFKSLFGEAKGNLKIKLKR
jgi:hypothetical protein